MSVLRFADNPLVDLRPVVKLFLPTSAAVWLITEFDEAVGLVFGLCDLGLGYPEIGYVAVSELLTAVGPLGIRIAIRPKELERLRRRDTPAWPHQCLIPLIQRIRP